MSDPNAPDERIKPLHWRALGVFCVIAMLNLVDRTLLASAMPAIKGEFHISDTAIGWLGMSFAIVYAVGGLPTARIADKFSRKKVIVAMAAVWSLFTALCGLANSYMMLLLSRLGVAYGESGSYPAIYSSLSDMFPPRKRAIASSGIIACSSAGVMIGLGLGGWLTAHYGWRAAFIYVGLGGLIIAAIAYLLIPEPERGVYDKGTSHDASSEFGWWDGFKTLFINRIFLWSILTCGFFGFSQGMVHWLPSFFQRTHEMPLSQVGLIFGSAFGMGLILGTLASGFLSAKLSRKRVYDSLWLNIFANAMLIPTFLIVLLVPSDTVAIIVTLIMSFVGALGGPPLTAAVQNSVPQRLRAMAHAIFTLFLAIFSYGLAPLLVGRLSDWYAETYGVAEGLRYALVTSAVMFVAALFFSILAFRAGRQAWREEAAAANLAAARLSPVGA